MGLAWLTHAKAGGGGKGRNNFEFHRWAPLEIRGGMSSSDCRLRIFQRSFDRGGCGFFLLCLSSSSFSSSSSSSPLSHHHHHSSFSPSLSSGTAHPTHIKDLSLLGIELLTLGFWGKCFTTGPWGLFGSESLDLPLLLTLVFVKSHMRLSILHVHY